MLSRLRESGLSLGMRHRTCGAGTAECPGLLGWPRAHTDTSWATTSKSHPCSAPPGSYLGMLISARSKAFHRHTARGRHRELPGLAEVKLRCHKLNILSASTFGLAEALGAALAFLHEENFWGGIKKHMVLTHSALE